MNLVWESEVPPESTGLTQSAHEDQISDENAVRQLFRARLRSIFDELSETGYSGGLEIVELDPDSTAFLSGMLVGDSLLAIGNFHMTSFKELRFALEQTTRWKVCSGPGPPREVEGVAQSEVG